MAAYHLAGNIEDATSNLNNGIEVGNGNNDPKNGIIGYARFFGGGACFQAIGLPERPRGTLSFWFRTETTFNAQSSTTQGIWGKTESDEYNANISLRGADFLAGGSGTTGQIQTKIENNNFPQPS